ncbi:DUF4073 domain-containing protein [Vallitalea guaymasensis]|uniref:DUF4073 domain-containing protein n=1 Tax=Vallitalea guaymasensis TaxID=1185412 RepID=UPI0023530754|nr:DUF4073 domain-containing protein [Vallitalea guaymasensis]
MRKYKILKQLFTVILVIAITVTGIPINSYANETQPKAQTIDVEQALKNKTENDNIPLENENINNTNDNELMKDNQEEEENEDESSDDGINTEGNNQNQKNQNIDKDEEQVSDENNGEKVDDTHDFDNDNSNENVEENIEGNKDDNSENGSLNNESDGDNKNANLDKEEDDLDKLDESNNKKQANELSSVVISNVAGRSKVNIYIGNEFYEHLDGETSDDMLIIEPKGTIIRLEAIDYPGADPTHIFNCWFVQSQLSNTYITDSIIEFNIEDYIKVTPWHNANLKPKEKEVIISGDSAIEIPYKNDVTKNYTAEVYDKSGNIIEDSTITWSLKDELVGVNINQTGRVTVTSEATVGNFTIIAITQNGTKGEMQIQLSPYDIPDAPNLIADDINNIITGQDANRENMEYTIGDSDNWETYDSDNPPDLTMDVVIKLRFIGTETIPPSNITTLQFNYNYIENFNDDKEIYTDVQSDNRGYLSVKHYDIANDSQVDENDRVKMFGDERYSDFIIQTPIESAYGDYFDMYNESQQGSLYFEANYNNNSHEAYEKAIVMWGYFVPEKTGEYQLYAYSDDGIYGSLTVGNEDKIFVNKWQYQSPSTRGNGTVYQMQEGKIYPIYMNFFENRKSQSAFKLQMSFNGNTIEDVPGTYLYPSSKNLAYNNNVPVMGINVEPESTIINLDENDSITLNATIEPVNATNKNINWSSSDDSIATVDSNGNVTLNKVGVVTITATTEDGNFEGNCVITINSNISGDPNDFFYASDNKGTLVKYYPYRNSNKTDKIASKIDDYRDIATLPDGTLVGVTQNGNLYKNIELGIDEREKIGPGFYINNEDNHSYFNDFYGVNALTSDSNGNLYYVEEDYGIIRKYDITNNEITDVVATGLSSAGDIVFLDANTIYYTAYDYWNYYYLVKVNITTKHVSQIARLSGIPYGIASLNSKLFVTYANNNKSYVDVYDPEGNKLNDRSEKINHLKKVFGAAQGIGKIVSNPPVAKDVRIEGSAKVGEELTGLYTYEDSEGDEEGNSRYQWYKSERDSSSYTPINYATTKKLLITKNLIGCTIKFEVTPIAKTGTYLEGNAVRSNPTEKVVPIPFKLIGPYDYDYFYLNDRNGKIIKYYPESNNYEQVAYTNKTYLDIANYNDDIIGVRDGKLYENITTNPIKIKEISDSTINSLTYNNGLYYYVEGTNLYAYNPNTETFYELKDIGYTSQGDLVAFDGDMYFLAATRNGYYTKLIKIDFDNNYSTSVIGEYYSGYSMGIAAANNTLFVGYSNIVAKVNLQTGYLYDETRIRGLNNIYGAAQGGYDTPVVSSITIYGDESINVPTQQSSPQKSEYKAIVKDQYGNIMDENVSWSLKEAIAGVTINSNSGIVEVTNEAPYKMITIIARINDVTCNKNVKLNKIPEVTGNDNTNVLIGADNTMEYSTDEGQTWKEYDSSVTFPGNVKVEVRYKETELLTASEATEIIFTKNTPEAPEVTGNDNTNVLIGADETMEYSTDKGQTWNDYDSSLTYPGDIKVKVRYKETELLTASESTEVIFTKNTPEAPEVTGNDDFNKLVGADETMEYSTDEGQTWKEYDSSLTYPGDIKVKVRYKETELLTASESTEVIFTKNTPEVPEVTGNDDSNKLVGADNTMEYSTDEGQTWNDYDSNVTFPGNVKVKVRYKETELLTASESTEVIFTKNTPEAPEVTENDETNVLIGGDETMEYSTDEGQTWNDYDSSLTYPGDVKVKVRYKETALLTASKSTEVMFTKNTPEAPEVTGNDNTNVLIGADETMEYSTDNGNAWITYNNSNIPRFPGNITVKVRYKETSLTNASNAIDVRFTINNSSGGGDTPSGGGDTPSGGGDTPSGGGDNPSGGDNNPSDGGDTTDDNEDGDLDEEIIIDEPTTPLGAIEFYEPYIKGFPDGSFKPKKAVTRAEVAAMFARILKLDTEESGDSSYTDVTNAHWAYKYIQAITKIGLFKGYDDGTFKPNQAIKRSEIAVVFSAYWDYVGAEVKDDESIFTDISGHWAQSYINKLYNAGVVKGFEDKTFRPDTDTAREQIVIMINKIIARPKLDAVNPSFSDVSNDHWAYGDIEAASVKFNKEENNEEENQDSEDQQ